MTGVQTCALPISIELNLEVEKIPTESDRNGWEQNMKRYVGGKLNAAQHNGVKHTISLKKWFFLVTHILRGFEYLCRLEKIQSIHIIR